MYKSKGQFRLRDAKFLLRENSARVQRFSNSMQTGGEDGRIALFLVLILDLNNAFRCIYLNRFNGCNVDTR